MQKVLHRLALWIDLQLGLKDQLQVPVFVAVLDIGQERFATVEPSRLIISNNSGSGTDHVESKRIRTVLQN